MNDNVHRLSIDDERLSAYRHLKRTNLTRWSGRFIAEGEKLVERLLQSRFETDSILLSEKRLDLIEKLPASVTVFVLSQHECEQLTGYEFHQGVLACGIRQPSLALADVLPVSGRATLVIAPHITDPDNLGALVRLSAGFGVTAVVLGRGSADPFSRRSLRISMGTAFTLPIVERVDVPTTLASLRDRGVELVATVLDDKAAPLMTARRSESLALLFGNEAHGLSPDEIAACHQRVTIPMAAGADSLNVSSAAAIVLYHFTRVA